ncbi:serine/threonine-protein kinase [Streptomyces sp. NPDC014894]|uniref:serine/threonine-protein kinase n=1 Tax=unclassified Streptomyces TaxID=2593676 RepID=UPI0036FE7B97
MDPLGTGDPLRLGPYRLAGVLGAGGMGKVYLGHDGQGRPAAVKVLLPHLTHDQHLVRRFLREAETARSVTGKGVARVLAAQTEGGRPWIATEFLSGPTLEDAVSSYGPLAPDALRALAASLADALRSIHATGLIHRDLKPANIVLTSSGPSVIDFGIARPEHGLTLTTTGQAPVTPGFGAPEQAMGQRVGPAADVFSLGAVLVYAAGGRPAYRGDHVAAVQYEVVHGEPDLSRVPPEFRPLILPCLAKDPALRPTPEQIAGAFAPPRRGDRIWRQGPLSADIERRETQARQWATLPGTVVADGPGRRRFLTRLAVATALVGAAGGGTAVVLTRRGDGKEDGKTARKHPAGKPGERVWGPLSAADPWSPPAVVVGDTLVFGSKEGGLVGHATADGAQRWKRERITPSSEFRALDGDSVAAADAAGRLYAIDAASGEERWAVAADADLVIAANDSAVYVQTRDDRIRAIDTRTRKVLWTVPAQGFDKGYGNASDERLVLRSPKGTAFALDTETGARAWHIKLPGDSVSVPALDAETAVIGGKSLSRVRLADGEKVWSVPSSGDPVLPQWGSAVIDGELVYAVDSTVLRCHRLSDGKEVWRHDIGTLAITYYAPQIVGGHVCEVTAKEGVNSFDALALDKLTGRPAWRHGQRSPKSLKLTSDGERLYLLQAESTTALSGGS